MYIYSYFYFFSYVVIKRTMARVYSPTSPYARVYESHGRTYASRSSGFVKKAKKYLTGEQGKHFRTGVLVFLIISFIMAAFMTYIMHHDFTQDEMDGNWGKMQKLVDFSKSEKGKITIYTLWGIGAVCTGTLVYAHCNKKY